MKIRMEIQITSSEKKKIIKTKTKIRTHTQIENTKVFGEHYTTTENKIENVCMSVRTCT